MATEQFTVQPGKTETDDRNVSSETVDVTGGGTLALGGSADYSTLYDVGSTIIVEQASADVSVHVRNGGTVEFDQPTNTAGTNFDVFSLFNAPGSPGTELIFGDASDAVPAGSLDNSILGFGPGATIELAGITFNGATLTGTTLDLTENGTTVYQLTSFHEQFGTPPGFVVGVDPKTGFDFVAAPCYGLGTRILTKHGEVAVEDLREGDLVATLSGRGAPFKSVKWVGRREVDIAAHPKPHEVRPIRIAAGAFGDGMPHRDLVVSPGHAVFVDGVLINAHKLINDVTITQDLDATAVRYFHVELAGHDILLAEGMPAESYLDTGNRAAFVNSGQVVSLHPDLAPKSMHKDACEPFVDEGPILDAVRQRLIDRVKSLGYQVIQDPDLRLLMNGRVVRPTGVDGQAYRFELPETAQDIRIVSRSATPAGVSSLNHDERRLGVGIAAIVLHADGESREIPLDDPGLAEGFCPVETENGATWRWTEGNARLPVELLGSLSGPAALELRLAWPGAFWTRQPAVETVRRTA